MTIIAPRPTCRQRPGRGYFMPPHPQPKKKLYCYVDESGQDTKGTLFVVVTVIVAEAREEHREFLRSIEKLSRRGPHKWTKSTRAQRYAYVEEFVKGTRLRKSVFFSRFSNTTNYQDCIVKALSDAVSSVAGKEVCELHVIIDGISKRECHQIGPALRRRGKFLIRKVRGMRDESDEFIRLADSIAGLIRDDQDGIEPIREIYKEAVRKGLIEEI